MLYKTKVTSEKISLNHHPDDINEAKEMMIKYLKGKYKDAKPVNVENPEYNNDDPKGFYELGTDFDESFEIVPENDTLVLWFNIPMTSSGREWESTKSLSYDMKNIKFREELVPASLMDLKQELLVLGHADLSRRIGIIIAEKIIAYHGSPYDFSKFDFKNYGRNDKGDYGKGVYFDTDKSESIAYVQANKGFLYECELNLVNPYLIDRSLKSNKSEVIKDYVKELRYGGISIDRDENNFVDISRRYGSENITKALTENGYDSVKINWGSSQEIVVFDVKNINIITKHDVVNNRIV